MPQERRSTPSFVVVMKAEGLEIELSEGGGNDRTTDNHMEVWSLDDAS